MPVWTSRFSSPISVERPGTLSRQGPPALRWALFEATLCASRPAAQTTSTTRGQRSGSGPTGRACQSRASPQAQLSPAARARRGGAGSCMTLSVRARLFVTQMRRGRLHARSCRHVRVDGPYRPSGRNASPAGSPHQPSCRRPGAQPGSRTEIRLSARAHTIRTATAPTHPPNTNAVHPPNPAPPLEPRPCTDKEQPKRKPPRDRHRDRSDRPPRPPTLEPREPAGRCCCLAPEAVIGAWWLLCGECDNG